MGSRLDTADEPLDGTMLRRPESRFGYRDEKNIQDVAAPAHMASAQPSGPSRPESRWGHREEDLADESPLPRDRPGCSRPADGAPLTTAAAVGELSEDVAGASFRSKMNAAS